MKRIGKQALLLLVTTGILLSLGGCKKGPGGGSGLSDPYADKTHAEVSELLYEEVLGEFHDYYTRATEAATVSERYALMAIAEAKLLGSGVMLPSTANGGNYAISRVAPRTVTSVLWGSDEFRFHNALVVKGNPLRRTEVEEMKAEWAKRRGTGNYEAWAKSYLKGKGYTLGDTYDYAYTADPTTWDWHNTNQSPDFRALVNLYDGLYEYDAENRQMPALATSHEVSEDGLTYTFHIRPGVQWVNYQGTPIEEVTATSFVRGFQHLLDAGAGLEALVDGVVRGVSAYLGDEVTDFNAVGVRAPDRYTLVYELEQPCSYFPTMLSYALFAPISEAYFLANGGAFGRAAFAAILLPQEQPQPGNAGHQCDDCKYLRVGCNQYPQDYLDVRFRAGADAGVRSHAGGQTLGCRAERQLARQGAGKRGFRQVCVRFRRGCKCLPRIL